MMKYRLIYHIIFISLLLTSCHDTIHEHPDAGDANVSLTMKVKTSGPELHAVVEYTSNSRYVYKAHEYKLPETRSDMAQTLSGYLEQTSINAEMWDMRLVWELYEGTRDDLRQGRAILMSRDSVLINYEDEMPEHTINFMAPSGRYTLLAWSDFVPKGTLADYYYDTQDMNMLMSDFELRKACLDNDQRDCFAQAYDFKIETVEFQGQKRYYETMLKRPQGRYVILATDYDSYLDLSDNPVEQNIVNITYPSFINVGYSIVEQRPNESATGLTYSFTPRIYEFDEQKTVCVGDDYSFVNGEISYIHATLQVCNPDGIQLSFNKNIEIPIYADKLTVVVGKFFVTSGGSGGISIDDGFEDEIIVPYQKDLDKEQYK